MTVVNTENAEPAESGFDLSSLPELDPNDVSEYLGRAVSRYGNNYCDPESQDGGNCRNVYRNEDTGEVTARCIAAEVLSIWGVPDVVLERHNNYPVGHVISEFDLPVSKAARVMLGAAQSAQDKGCTWMACQLVANRVRDELRQTGLVNKG